MKLHIDWLDDDSAKAKHRDSKINLYKFWNVMAFHDDYNELKHEHFTLLPTKSGKPGSGSKDKHVLPNEDERYTTAKNRPAA